MRGPSATNKDAPLAVLTAVATPVIGISVSPIESRRSAVAPRTGILPRIVSAVGDSLRNRSFVSQPVLFVHVLANFTSDIPSDDNTGNGGDDLPRTPADCRSEDSAENTTQDHTLSYI